MCGKQSERDCWWGNRTFSILFFKLLKSQNFLMKNLKKVDFLTKTFFQVLEIFLEQIWAWPKYDECCSDIALSNGKKIRVVRHVLREKFLWKYQNLIFYTFEESEFSTEKFEKSGFFDENFFSSPPRKLSRTDMDMTKVWRMLLWHSSIQQ